MRGFGSKHWNWTGSLVWIGPRDLFEVRHDGRWTQSRDAAPGFNVNAGDWEAWRNEGVITEVTSTHARGVRSVDVADASDLAPGVFVLMTWDNPRGDLLWKEIARHAAFDGYNFGDWLEATPYFGWPVEIASVEGNTVSFARPTRVSVEPGYNTALRRIGPSVREAGIESMTLRMADTRETYSYNDGVGWNGVFFNRAFNCWARDLKILDAETPLNVSSSVNVSALDVETAGAMQAKTSAWRTRTAQRTRAASGCTIRSNTPTARRSVSAAPLCTRRVTATLGPCRAATRTCGSVTKASSRPPPISSTRKLVSAAKRKRGPSSLRRPAAS